LWLLRTSTSALEQLAERSAAAAVLLTAHRNACLPPGPARTMGVINVTPDSFSDGGRWLDPERAIEQGLKLARGGADILDVGGESTRPGAAQVSAEEECDRVLPVVAGLASAAGVPISIDTTKATVAERALEAGATVINDVSAGRFDPAMFSLAAERCAGIVLMHMQGTPRDMQRSPCYDDVVREVTDHLRERVERAWQSGIDPSRIALDPGIGFGKRLEDNLELIRAIPELRSLGLPVCLGVSRKSFLGRLTGAESADRRDAETIGAVAIAALLGAEIHRVHDVEAARRALRIAAALGPGPSRVAREA
jgi:dihydropteroate synthase